MVSIVWLAYRGILNDADVPYPVEPVSAKAYAAIVPVVVPADGGVRPTVLRQSV